MARKDLLQRYAEAEQDYLEMLDNLVDLKKELDDGAIDVDTYNQYAAPVEEEMAKCKERYASWAAVIIDLNRGARKKKLDKTTEKLYEDLKKASNYVLYKPNEDVLGNLKKLIKEGKIDV